MKLETLYVLAARSQGLIRIIRRPCLMTSSDKIMAKAIKAEFAAAKEHKREFEPWNAIHKFQLATGALRLTNAEANLLLSVIYKAMQGEGKLTTLSRSKKCHPSDYQESLGTAA